MSYAQDELSVRGAYDEVAETYAAAFASTEPEQSIDLAMIEYFVSRLGPEPQVLDAGCGAGRLLPVLAEWGCHVEGIDLSARMVHCAQRDHPQFTVQLASLTDLPFADECFDGVVSWYSTIHNPDQDLPRIAEQLRRVVRPGGLALVAFQCGSGTRDVSASYRAHGHEVTLHRFNRPADQLSDVFTTAGLDEVCRMQRRAVKHRERDDQSVLLFERPIG